MLWCLDTPACAQQVVSCAEIIKDAGVTIPQDANPFCTQPAVDVARGSEITLPAGQVSLEFSAGLMRLAAMLAHEPRLIAEVWHKVK
jgi:centrosomal protein CEP120